MSSPADSLSTQVNFNISDIDRQIQLYIRPDCSAKQITSIYKLSGENYLASSTCLVEGPTVLSVLDMINSRFSKMPRHKLTVDAEDVWAELVSLYKGKNFNPLSQLRFTIEGKPSIDTGGVRKQVYTTVYGQFCSNWFIHVFDGPDNRLRPACTARVRSSGLLKIVGSIVAHSICQDGIGFPYFSLTCYWYMVAGQENGLEFATVEDVSADAAYLIKQV